jgi:hypothetical protein
MFNEIGRDAVERDLIAWLDTVVAAATTREHA